MAALALTKKAVDVRLIDLRKVTDVADFFIVCSADSDIQVKAIADAVLDGLAESDIHPWHREGLAQKQWILLDFVDVVVHIFHRDVRNFYALEKLWGDAKIVEVTDTPKKPRAKSSPRKKSTTARTTKKAPRARAKS
jgi:ribosome-associated protein